MKRLYTLSFAYSRGTFRNKKVVPLTDSLLRLSYSVEAVSEAQAKFFLREKLTEDYGTKVHCIRDLSITSSLYLGTDPNDLAMVAVEDPFPVFDQFPL